MGHRFVCLALAAACLTCCDTANGQSSPIPAPPPAASFAPPEAPTFRPLPPPDPFAGVTSPPAFGYDVIQTAGAIPHPPLVAAEPEPLVADQIDQLPEADLAERLRAAEARIKDLENYRATDKKKDAQTARVLDTLKDRWDSVRDPAITTVDQQTYDAAAKKPSEKKWHDRLSIRGYTQMRLNETLGTAAGSAPPQTVLDRSVGDDQEFFLRRARMIISGDVSDRMYVYLQTEFAATVTGSPDNTHYAQIRDWYADLYLDDCKVNRLRVGQSKVPYGWDTLQSSSNRIPLERSDGINTAVRNERDLGVFYYWTPEPAQDFFKYVLDEGLKGSGNYGVFGMGVYNGQGGSFVEQNDNVHFVARLTVPHRFAGGQCMEVGVQGYVGQYGVLGSGISPLGVGGPTIPDGTVNGPVSDRNILDERIAASWIWYPQPIGFQAEWNVGRGPALNDAQTLVDDRSLYGGYLQTMVKVDTRCWGTLFPYLRWVKYRGGYKSERNAPFSDIEEWEIGTEWQINPQMEFTMAYLLTDRTNTTALSTAGALSYRTFDGDVMRFQFQFNY